LGEVRGLLVDADKRPVLRLLPEMDEMSRGYALSHLGDTGCSLEAIADQVWLLNATDWLRGQDELSWSLYKTLNHRGFSRVLHEFAMKVAEDFLRDRKKQGGQVLKKSLELLEVKRRWMKGEISDQELREATDAYRVAASAASWAALGAAYWAADRAAYHAAYWAEHSAADGDVEKKKQVELLVDMLEDSVGIQRGQVRLLGEMLEDSVGIERGNALVS